MKIQELICIGCPLGCPIRVEIENGEVLSVAGNTCPRGEAYARKEVTNPTRIVTSTVKIRNSLTGAVRVPCKTASDVPKGKIQDVIRSIAGVTVDAPIKIGDVILKDAADTGVDMVATKDVK